MIRPIMGLFHHAPMRHNAAMGSAIILSAIAMTVIVAVRYMLTSGIFAWATARLRPGHYAGQDAIDQPVGQQRRQHLRHWDR